MHISNIELRKANLQDFDAIWEVFQAVVSRGDTYPYAPETRREQALELWMGVKKQTYLALLNQKVVGSYIITPNQPGLGSHVANAAYMVHPHSQGQGVGKAMVRHSLEEAKLAGYLAMQFNLVFSSNEPALRLYQKLGFQIIGTTPQGVRHGSKGLIDTYIMHRFV